MARDGELGAIRDYYFDESWTIRYLVVETGRWYSSQRVLISPEAVQKASWDLETLHFNLTKEAVARSPVFNVLKKPSRQFEMRLRAHYGWSAYWTGNTTPPLPPSENEPEIDASLSTLSDLNGFGVVAPDGDVGKVVNFLIDEVTWKIRCLVVQTNWLLGQHVLLSPQWIDHTDMTKRRIAIGQTCAVIKQRPPYNPLQAAVSDSIAV